MKESRDNINNLSVLDERMLSALEEENRANEERKKARKRKKRRHKIIFAVVIVTILAFVAVFLIKEMQPNYYQNEEEFKTFAASMFEKYELCPHPDDHKEIDSDESTDEASTEIETQNSDLVNQYLNMDYSYGDQSSTAIRVYISRVGDSSVDEEAEGSDREDAKAESQSFYEAFNSEHDRIVKYYSKKIDSYVNEYKEGISEEDGDSALLIDVTVTETSNGAYSFTILKNLFKEEEKEMVWADSEVMTSLFNEKNQFIDPIQILALDYRVPASAYAEEYISKYISEENRTENWEEYITSDETNFNKFLIKDDEVTFLFDEGTVADSSQGIVKIAINPVVFKSSIRPKIMSRYIDPNKPMVALTYDDGPGGKSETKILKTLEKYDAVATFFYLGNRVANFKDNAVKASEIGCEIGNHSWSHPQLSTLSKKQIKKQISKTNKAIEEYTGIEPKLYRPPYGDYSDKVLEAVDMPAILWSVDTLDWKTRDPKKIFKVVKKTKKLDGKIILMHSIYDETAKATSKMVPWLQKQGYQLVTVSELIQYRTGEGPKDGEVYIKIKK